MLCHILHIMYENDVLLCQNEEIIAKFYTKFVKTWLSRPCKIGGMCEKNVTNLSLMPILHIYRLIMVDHIIHKAVNSDGTDRNLLKRCLATIKHANI